MPLETKYTAAATEPDQIARATAQTLDLPTYYNGDPAIPTETGSTVTINDANGDAIVSAAAITVSGGVATYDLAAATVPATLAYSDDWMEFWSLVMPDGKTYPFRRSAALVHSRLYPVVAQTHMTERYSDLASWLNKYEKSLQPYINAAWRVVSLRLEESGRRPWLILNPSALFEYHLNLALSYTYADMSTSLEGGNYQTRKEDHAEEAEKAWQRISLRYDEDEDQIPDDGRTPAGPPVFLTRPGNWTD